MSVHSHFVSLSVPLDLTLFAPLLSDLHSCSLSHIALRRRSRSTMLKFRSLPQAQPCPSGAQEHAGMEARQKSPTAVRL